MLAALVVGVILAAGGSGGGGSGGKPERGSGGKPVRAKLILERGVQPESGYEEVIVSLPSQRLNNPGTTGGATSVLLRCFDKHDRMTIHQRHHWPLVEERGYPPHIHQPAVAKVLNGLGSCRLTGPGIDFAGRVAGRLPPIKPVQ